MDSAKIETKVKKIIPERLCVDPCEVTDDARLVDDLGVDSLDAIDLVMEFEEEFDIEIQDDDYANIKTVGDAVNCVVKAAESRDV